MSEYVTQGLLSDYYENDAMLNGILLLIARAVHFLDAFIHLLNGVLSVSKMVKRDAIGLQQYVP